MPVSLYCLTVWILTFSAFGLSEADSQKIYENEYRAYQSRTPEVLSGTAHKEALAQRTKKLAEALPSDPEKVFQYYGLDRGEKAILQSMDSPVEKQSLVLNKITMKMDQDQVLADLFVQAAENEKKLILLKSEFDPLHKRFMDYLEWRESQMVNNDPSTMPDPDPKAVELNQEHFKKRQEMNALRARAEWTKTEIVILRRVMALQIVQVLELDPRMADRLVPPSKILLRD